MGEGKRWWWPQHHKDKKESLHHPPNKTNSTNEINLSRRVFSLPSMAQSNNREHQIRDVVFYLYFALDSSATPEAIEPLACTAAAARSRIPEKKEKRIEKINVRRAATPPIVWRWRWWNLRRSSRPLKVFDFETERKINVKKTAQNYNIPAAGNGTTDIT